MSQPYGSGSIDAFLPDRNVYLEKSTIAPEEGSGTLANKYSDDDEDGGPIAVPIYPESPNPVCHVSVTGSEHFHVYRHPKRPCDFCVLNIIY